MPRIVLIQGRNEGDRFLTQTSSNIRPIKVAILGGGPSALACALELTDPQQAGKYDVTIHQLGWRLGGKCASGRNQESHERIEEHGLHVFFGYYDNAFNILRRAYEELETIEPGQKYPTVYDALVPSSCITVCEDNKDGWDTWSFNVPKMPGLPGEDGEPSLWKALLFALRQLAPHFGQLTSSAAHTVASVKDEQPSWWDRLVEKPFKELERLISGTAGIAYSLAHGLLDDLMNGHDGEGQRFTHEHQSRLVSLMEHAWTQIEELWSGPGFEGWWQNLENDLKRAFIILDLAFTIGLGALRSGFFFNREAAIAKMNELDFRDWLTQQGAKSVTVNSAMVRAFYDLTFAYPDGDHKQTGNLSAGGTIAGMFNMILYRGAFMWKMRAGTGDIVATPLYKVLKNRGVKFEFFHRVTQIVPSQFGDQIEKVEISRQVNLSGADYNPLIPVKGLDCWPSEPLYDQIVEGAELKSKNINLESFWTPWTDTGGTIELKQSVDFDLVVCGIPVDSLRTICPQIIAQKSEWKAMVEGVKTVQTQSVQMLFDVDNAQMGELPTGTVIGANDSSPLDAAADISEVLPAENWPATGAPVHLSIMAGALPGPDTAPPADQTGYPAKMQTAVKATALDYIANGAPVVWPKLIGSDGFDWSKMWASDAAATGADRLNSQYLRANIDPDQRYTLSVAGSDKLRLRTDQSGYDNLYLTGDWIDNPGNLGGFESTIMSGRLAARAVSGFPKTIARVDKGSRYYDMRPPFLNPQTAPLFVEYNGMQTFPGPFSFKNVKAWSFFLEADYDKLVDVCNQMFTVPSGGEVSYVPLTNMMMMSFMDITDAQSAHHAQASGAYEQEVALWIMMGRRESPSSNKIVSISGFTPYLVINNPLGFIEGRNVWGYMKQAGHLSLPSKTDPGFKVDAYGVRTDPFNTPWDYHRVLTMTQQEGHESIPGIAFDGMEEAIHLIKQALTGQGHTASLHPTWELAENLVEDFFKREMHQIFLKQFRDIQFSERACYQAITQAPMHLGKVSGVTITQPYEVVFQDLFNTAIVETLGLPAKTTVPFGMQFTMDFALKSGTVLWKANSTL